MWAGAMRAYGAVMQSSTDRLGVGSAGRAIYARPLHGIAAALPLLSYVLVLALAAGMLARSTGGLGFPYRESSSEQQLNEDIASPTEVIDAFLATQSVHDVDAGATFFETDASITDRTGRTNSGTDAVRGMIGNLQGWEAGPRQATGDQVIWAESLPIWKLPAAPTELDLRLEQEVPHYAAIQLMCAVITGNKIHALIALPTSSPRSCDESEPI
jgi:hypothetical protein